MIACQMSQARHDSVMNSKASCFSHQTLRAVTSFQSIHGLEIETDSNYESTRAKLAWGCQVHETSARSRTKVIQVFDLIV